MPTPLSATVSSNRPVEVDAATTTSEPGGEYFTALSNRLNTAETSWRRSPCTTSSGSTSTETSTSAFSAAVEMRATASPTIEIAWTSPNSASSPNSIRDSSSRSSTVHEARSASVIIRSASRDTTSLSGSSRIVSASSPSAPIGVLSSWLMFATKSRRTVSVRRCRDRSSTSTSAPLVEPPSKGMPVTT